MRLRVYTKTELARLYFPDSSAVAARQRLWRAICRCKPLYARLTELGMLHRQRHFTPGQVKEIIYYLGEP